MEDLGHDEPRDDRGERGPERLEGNVPLVSGLAHRADHPRSDESAPFENTDLHECRVPGGRAWQA
ncbi:hypothetical protein AK37_21691 [Rhodococcus pyridinivorans AK37]|uniref:Uncharacterized protein n=1 Tax=Rhodococcus pyridinivorans AK37 TaxID=1114960 RepID=H0JX61_9NOCA|nr:hypothetical protein AK37_21691 [Rhodococcus pyridinivorans AK37]